MTAPEGQDLWLPDRMAAVGVIMSGERDIFQDYGRMLDGFFAAIRGEILKPLLRIIDPFGVFKGVNTFNRLLADFLAGGVTKMLETAYGRVLGDNYPFTNRPYVARHLEQVRNRLVRIPDQVFDFIRVAVDEGINEGESVPEMAERIDQQFLRSNSETWTNRATVVARTEAMGAYNAGSWDAFEVMEEELDTPFEKVWLATIDSRTRDSHFIADGQRVPFNSTFTVGGFPGLFPGDPMLPPQEVIQCRCTFLVVEPGETTDMRVRGWRHPRDRRREVSSRAQRGIIREGEQQEGWV